MAVGERWSGTYDLTWWGKNRQTHLVAVVAQETFAEPPFCPPEVAALIEAIEDYGRRTLGVAVPVIR